MGRRLVRSHTRAVREALHHKCTVIELCKWFPPVTLSRISDGYRYLWSNSWMLISRDNWFIYLYELPMGDLQIIRQIRIFRVKVQLLDESPVVGAFDNYPSPHYTHEGWSRIIKAIPYIVGSLAFGYFEVSVFSKKCSTSTLWIPILDELCKDVKFFQASIEIVFEFR